MPPTASAAPYLARNQSRDPEPWPNARNTYAIRLAVEGGGQVKAELVSVGQSGEQSLKRIENAGDRAAGGLKGLGRQAELQGTGEAKDALARWALGAATRAATCAAARTARRVADAFARIDRGQIGCGSPSGAGSQRRRRASSSDALEEMASGRVTSASCWTSTW